MNPAKCMLAALANASAASALLLSATACGGDASIKPDAANDSALDAPDGTPITVRTTALAPVLVAYREATASGWMPAEMTGSTTFRIWVRGPYVVTVVCQFEENYIQIHQVAQTVEDPHDLELWCNGSGTHRLTGETVPSAWLWINGSGAYSEPGQGFELHVPTGTYDLIAMTEQSSLRADRIAFRRGIVVAADVALANPIDLVVEGTALLPTAVTVTNAMQGETARVRGSIQTRYNEGAPLFVSTSLDQALFVPNSALMSTDVQTLTVSAISNGFARRVERRFREGDSTEFTLPDSIGAVTFSRTGGEAVAAWSTVPDHDLLWVEISSPLGPPFVNYDVKISRSYEAEVGVTSISTETSIPGFRPEWKIDLEKEYTQSLTAERRVGNDLLRSSHSITANAPSPRSATDDTFGVDARRLMVKNSRS